MKKMNNEHDEHDITKNMLNIIREGIRRGGLLREDNGSGEATQPSSEDALAEEKNLRDIVNPRVTVKAFNIYPNDNNVVLVGEFDNDLQFQFDKREGLYINANNLKLDSEMAELIKKLSAYYVNWGNDWATKLSTDYKNNV